MFQWRAGIKPTTCLIYSFCNEIRWKIFVFNLSLFSKDNAIAYTKELNQTKSIKSASRVIGLPEAETKVISSTTFYVNQLN
jgi:hypothetical protein